MKRLSCITSMFLFFTLTAGSAQHTETRAVNLTDPYEAITVAGTQDVFFEIGPAGNPITVIGHKEDLDNLEITVAGGTLLIQSKKGYRSKSKKGVQVYVKNPTLKGATVSGTGDIDIKGRLDNGENRFAVSGTGDIKIESVDCRVLECSVSGTGDIRCRAAKSDDITAMVSGTGDIDLGQVTAENLDIAVRGTGDIRVKGRCTNATYTCVGTGDISARDMEATDVVVKISGAGDITCRCSGKFEGNSHGSGDIILYGNPENIKFSGNDKSLKRR